MKGLVSPFVAGEAPQKKGRGRLWTALALASSLLLTGPPSGAQSCHEALQELSHDLFTSLRAKGTQRSRPGRRSVDLSKQSELLTEIEAALNREVIAQPAITASLLRVLARLTFANLRESSAQNLTEFNGPGGTLLIPGPTGVGKNLSLKTLARVIGAEVLEYEGGDYMEKSHVNNLTGSPPSFVGHGTTHPRITQERIDLARGQRLPITIIMLNELDKAHPNFRDWWLKALDEGHNTVWVPDPQSEGTSHTKAISQRVDFRQTLIVATTNAGARTIQQQSRQIEDWARTYATDKLQNAFGVGDLLALTPPESQFRQKVEHALLKVFDRPEFLGRWDEIAVAWPLFPRGYMKVLDNEIKNLRRKLEDVVGPLPLKVTPRAKRWLISHVNGTFGARNVTKVVKKFIASKIHQAFASGELQIGDFIAVDLNLTHSDLALYAKTWTSVVARPHDKRHLNQGERRSEAPPSALPPNLQLIAGMGERTPPLAYERALNTLSTWPLGGRETLSDIFPTILQPPFHYSTLMARFKQSDSPREASPYVDLHAVLLVLDKVEKNLSVEQAQALATAAKAILSKSPGFREGDALFQKDLFWLTNRLIQEASATD